MICCKVHNFYSIASGYASGNETRCDSACRGGSSFSLLATLITGPGEEASII